MRYTIVLKGALYVIIPNSLRFVMSKESLPIILAYSYTLAILLIRG